MLSIFGNTSADEGSSLCFKRHGGWLIDVASAAEVLPELVENYTSGSCLIAHVRLSQDIKAI